MTEPPPDLDLPALRRLLDGGPTPLFATVSGAHLYGFSSPDSDVDLRGAFVAPLTDVLGLRPWEDSRTVTRQEGPLELDWVCHEVAKFATLMTRHNGYVLEQLYSPLVVLGGPWLDGLRGAGQGCITRGLVHHYRGFARSQRRRLGGEAATVKDLLYAYRVLLTGIHALAAGAIESHLPTLLERAWPATLGAGEREAVLELVARKRAGDEHGALRSGEADAHGPALDRLEEALEGAHRQSGLPAECTSRDALHDLVVRARLELGR